MNIRVTEGLRAYIEKSDFRAAIDGLVPRLDRNKAIQIKSIKQYHDFNDALLTAAQVHHDLIAFIMSACEASFSVATSAYGPEIEWKHQSLSEVWENSRFWITVDPKESNTRAFELTAEANFSKGTLWLYAELYDKEKDTYLHVNVTEEQALAAGLRVELDEDGLRRLSSEKFKLSNFLTRPDDFAATLSDTGARLTKLVLG